jgi:hypothetical protein
MKNYFLTLAATSAVAFSYVVIIQIMEAESSMPKAVAAAADGAKPTRQEYSLPSAVNIPSGYHDGKLIVMSHPVTGEVVPWRPQFDNEMAINAFEAETLPISDNATTAALPWNRVPSEDQNRALAGAFRGARSFVPGSIATVQVMVKDSDKAEHDGRLGIP